MRWRPTALLAVMLTIPSACAESAPLGSTAPVAAVTVEPLTGEVWAGEIRQVQAIARAADGRKLSGRSVVWSSTDPAVATISPDGRLEARGAGTTVITATVETRKGQLNLTVSEADLVFEGYASGFPEIFVLSLRGGEPTRVLPPHTVASDPTPSPDGSRIAFVIADPVDQWGDIYVMDRDGGNVSQLTFAGPLDDQPSWSPDGRKIAFRSFRTNRLGDIWVMNADGSDPRLLTPDPLPGVSDESRPAWSPDRTRIAYASNLGGTTDIWSMRADGGDKRRLTNTADYDTEPTWSPDGGTIAFRRSSEGQDADILTMGADGGEPIRLTHPGRDELPSWSPDGRLIAFTHRPGGGGAPQVYTMRPDGTEITLRTDLEVGSGGRAPEWLRRTR